MAGTVVGTAGVCGLDLQGDELDLTNEHEGLAVLGLYSNIPWGWNPTFAAVSYPTLLGLEPNETAVCGLLVDGFGTKWETISLTHGV